MRCRPGRARVSRLCRPSPREQLANLHSKLCSGRHPRAQACAHPACRPPRPLLPPAGKVVSPYQRVIMFVDNAGADAVLGMLPFARELLRGGAEARWAAGAAGGAPRD